ncbi:hypothetical protein J6590_101534 [Homalodisca vitripennis]|nr:hypothetical protein J6590_101534 [Homalodisca vitripennis]
MVQWRVHTSHCSAGLVYSLPSTTGFYARHTSLHGCETTSNIDTSRYKPLSVTNFKPMRVTGHLDLPISGFLDISYLARSVDVLCTYDFSASRGLRFLYNLRVLQTSSTSKLWGQFDSKNSKS